MQQRMILQLGRAHEPRRAQLLVHELGHVMQQRGGGPDPAGVQVRGCDYRTEVSMEVEADAFTASWLRLGPVPEGGSMLFLGLDGHITSELPLASLRIEGIERRARGENPRFRVTASTTASAHAPPQCRFVWGAGSSPRRTFRRG
jgi:hypothetical protein